MKNFKVVYLDEKGEKKSKEIPCYSITSAKTTFKKENKGKYSEILYAFSSDGRWRGNALMLAEQVIRL